MEYVPFLIEFGMLLLLVAVYLFFLSRAVKSGQEETDQQK